METQRIRFRLRHHGHQIAGLGQAPHPVELLAKHVLMVDEIPGPAARDPDVQGLLAQLCCAVQVTRMSPHRETLAQAARRHRNKFLISDCLRKLECLLGSGYRLLAPLCPLVSPVPSQESLDALTTAQLRQQLPQIVDRCLEVVEPGSGEPARQPNPAAGGVVRRQVERGIVVRDRLFERPAVERLLGSDHQIIDGLVGLPGLAPMMGKERGQILRLTSCGFDVSRDGRVALAAE